MGGNKKVKKRDLRKLDGTIKGLLIGILVFIFGIGFWYCFSRYIYYPKPHIVVKSTPDWVNSKFKAYDITIANSGCQSIMNFEFVIRFEKDKPIVSVSSDEISMNTDVKIRWYEDYKAKEESMEIFFVPVPFIDGFRCYGNELAPGSCISISTKTDNSYDAKANGDVFPPGLFPSTRNNSYGIQYRYCPFGFLGTIYITKTRFYDFRGNESINDYYRNYNRICITPAGDSIPFGIEISKKK